jgi:hypothetical protein
MIASTSPVQTCQACGDFEIVKPDGRGFPPDIAKNRLKKRCEAKGCAHNITYRAGLRISVDKRGF